MPTLRIEHPVPDFEAWKQAFDNDPLGREQSGVRRYRVFRSIDDPTYVMVDMEFDSVDQAQAMREALRGLWDRVQAEGLIGDQQVRLVETIESHEY